jgi:hypothetical protein
MRLAAEQPRETRTQKVMQCRPQQQRAAGVNVGRNTDPHLPRAHGEATAPNTTDGEHEHPHGHEQHGEDRRYMLDSDKRVPSNAGEPA